MNAEPARTDVELRMAEAMVDCAYGLGMTFGDAAKGEPDFDRGLKLYDAFHRSFQSVRLGIRLCLTLRSPAKPVSAPVATGADPEEADRSERERLIDRAERERGDREADYEPVSLTKFLASLRGVATDAAELALDTEPGVLPKLQTLLAEAEGGPPPEPAASSAVALKVRPPPSPARSRLLSSTARPVTLPGLGRPPPHRSG